MGSSWGLGLTRKDLAYVGLVERKNWRRAARKASRRNAKEASAPGNASPEPRLDCASAVQGMGARGTAALAMSKIKKEKNKPGARYEGVWEYQSMRA